MADESKKKETKNRMRWTGLAGDGMVYGTYGMELGNGTGKWNWDKEWDGLGWVRCSDIAPKHLDLI
jgi:hypothetical protein